MLFWASFDGYFQFWKFCWANILLAAKNLFWGQHNKKWAWPNKLSIFSQHVGLTIFTQQCWANILLGPTCWRPTKVYSQPYWVNRVELDKLQFKWSNQFPMQNSFCEQIFSKLNSIKTSFKSFSYHYHWFNKLPYKWRIYIYVRRTYKYILTDSGTKPTIL